MITAISRSSEILKSVRIFFSLIPVNKPDPTTSLHATRCIFECPTGFKHLKTIVRLCENHDRKVCSRDPASASTYLQLTTEACLYCLLRQISGAVS